MCFSTKLSIKLILVLLAFMSATGLIFCQSEIQLLEPANGSAGQELIVTFSWSGDVAGGTFRLQISRDPRFSDLFADVQFITNNWVQYQLADEGSYYWRVAKVIDNSSEAAQWTQPYVFKTVQTQMPKIERKKENKPSEKQLSTIPLMIPLDGTFTRAMARNDDGSSALINLPFTINFFGTYYNSLFINNNGNISFVSQYYSYTPVGFPSTEYSMIAPFWADIDTRNEPPWYPSISGEVWYKIESNRIIIIWSLVGYYFIHDDLLNNFELIISDGTPAGGLPPGTNVCFNYGDMQWTTGDASGGINGFGGYPATVGMNKGDGANYRQIGRFDHPGIDYDGAFGSNDGVDWLDGRTIYFRDDYNPPVAICNQNITAELNDNGVVNLTVDDIDNGSFDPEGSPIEMSISPSQFNCSQLGTHAVVLSITDNNYNVSKCTTYVTVADNIPPTVTCRDFSVTLDQDNYARIVFSDILVDMWDNCSITSIELSQYEFGCNDVGENTITLLVRDQSGNVGTCDAVVTVIDEVPPTIDVAVTPSVLWPPNHKMATITATVSTSDNCGGYSFVLSGITSNEADDGLGDGDAENDIQFADFNTEDLEFKLRKERSGTGMGRIYTITYTVTDAFGNTIDASAEVEVPHEWLKQGIFGDDDDAIITVIPNPFSDRTTIGYRLNYSSIVSLEIADLLGNVVYTEPSKVMKSGIYTLEWFGVDNSGLNLPSGIYYIRLNLGSGITVIPVTIFR